MENKEEMKAKNILKDMPNVKQGSDDFYGRQTVLNALNKVLDRNKELIEENSLLKEGYKQISDFMDNNIKPQNQ